MTIAEMSRKNDQKFDLEERTALFSESVIDFCKKLPRNDITRPVISQLIRAATSVGANYCEADDGESKKDFIHKLSVAKKEARESKYWLRMIAHACNDNEIIKKESRVLWQEAKELNLIFNAIINSTKNNSAKK